MQNAKSQRIALITLLFVTCLGQFTASDAASNWYKLSGNIHANGDVVDFEISPNNQYVVYTADPEGDAYIEWYSIIPDSTRVVFIRDQDEADLRELFSIPIAGPASAVVKLKKALPEDGDLWTFRVSPDSQWVIYSADQETDQQNELFSVPIAGPASQGVKLNDPLPSGGNIYSFAISSNSTHVVYRGEQETDEIDELFSVPITTTGAIKLNKPLVPGGSVGGFEIDPSGKFVIYDADQDTDGVDELY